MSSSPVAPYAGPTSLDAYLDQLRDPRADEAAEGEPSFVCRRPARGGAPPAAPARGRTRKEQGEVDRRKLRAALAEPDLKEKPRGDFEDMLSRIEPQFGDYDCLTDRQRGYVDDVLRELGVDERDPAERNAAVPRGREVAPAWNQLPLAPPGRTATCSVPPGKPGKLSRLFDESCCALLAARLASGGRSSEFVEEAAERDCLQCGGLCPRPA